MCSYYDDQKLTPLIRLGMLFLVAGALSLHYLPVCPGMNPDFADAVTGLFYGLAIGCMLVGISSRCRKGPAR